MVVTHNHLDMPRRGRRRRQFLDETVTCALRTAAWVQFQRAVIETIRCLRCFKTWVDCQGTWRGCRCDRTFSKRVAGLTGRGRPTVVASVSFQYFFFSQSLFCEKSCLTPFPNCTLFIYFLRSCIVDLYWIITPRCCQFFPTTRGDNFSVMVCFLIHHAVLLLYFLFLPQTLVMLLFCISCNFKLCNKKKGRAGVFSVVHLRPEYFCFGRI